MHVPAAAPVGRDGPGARRRPRHGERCGGQALRLDTTILFGTSPVAVQIPAALWVGSLDYSIQDLDLTTEYSRWYLRAYSSDTSVYPNTVPSVISERWYAMATYRVTSWLQPGVYYSIFYPNVAERAGRANQQLDGAATLRFDINSFWLIKLEGHYMSGTAGLSPSLNDGVPLSELAAHWAVFLVKTTAYF